MKFASLAGLRLLVGGEGVAPQGCIRYISIRVYIRDARLRIEYVMNINKLRQLWSRSRGTCSNGSGAPEVSHRNSTKKMECFTSLQVLHCRVLQVYNV